MDVLARLGAQAIGTALTVKPIIAPLFVSAPRPADPVAETSGDLVDPIPTEARSAATFTSLSAVERLAPPMEMTAHGDRKHPGGEASKGVRLGADVDRPAEAQGSFEDRIDVRPAHPAEPGPVPIEPPRPTAADVPLRAVSGRRPVERERTVKVAAKLLPTAPTDTAPTRRAVPPATAADVLVPTPRWNATTLLERLRTLGETAPDRSKRRDAVVRVSIGRIEVRATPSPQPVAVAASASLPPSAPVSPQRLTLAEYLERKKETR